MRLLSLRFPVTSPMKMPCAGLGLGVLLALAAVPSQASIVIDAFTTQQSLQVFGTPTGVRSSFSEDAAPMSVGGVRDIFLTRTSSNNGFVSADSNDSVSGAFAFSAGTGTSGTVRLQYDGSDGASTINPTGLGGISLLEPGTINNRFRFQATSDLGGDVIVRLFSGAGNSSTASFLVAADPSFSFQTYLLSFASFTTTAGTGANFANIGAIEIEVGSRSGVPVGGLDLAIDVINVEGDVSTTAVPEPATLALAGLGTVLAGVLRRKKPRRV